MSRADTLALELLRYGHTVAWTCDATTLPRHRVHTVAGRAGLTWHQDSDTMRDPQNRRQAPEVAELVDDLTAVLEQIPDARERRHLRHLAAVLTMRLDRAVYAAAKSATETTPAPAKQRRAPKTTRKTTRKD